MYGKVFESIYDGTLAGHWEAIVTMQQMIVLADCEGVVDMTPEAIARRTTIPLKIITKGIDFLLKPDPYSRTPGDDGKRIVPLDDHRPWGWRLVNFGKYRRLRNMEEKREADRERIAEKRKEISGVATESQKSPSVANVAHAVSSKQEAKKQSTRFARPEWIPEGPWSAWLEVRKKKRAPNTDAALSLAVKKLEELRESGNDPVKVLEQSTFRGWQGLFEVKSTSRSNESGERI